VTKAYRELPECREALAAGRLKADGAVLIGDGRSFVTKAAIEPVWHLLGIAVRFGASEDELRQSIFKETNSMYPGLLTRNDLELFLPPVAVGILWSAKEWIAVARVRADGHPRMIANPGSMAQTAARGNVPEMIRVSTTIQQGAISFLMAEYTYMAVYIVLFSIVLAFSAGMPTTIASMSSRPSGAVVSG